MSERMLDRLEDLKVWLKRKLCRHRGGTEYEEVRTKVDGRFRVHWSAMHVCPDCGDVLSVEASYYGNPYDVALAVDEEIRTAGGLVEGDA